MLVPPSLVRSARSFSEALERRDLPALQLQLGLVLRDAASSSSRACLACFMPSRSRAFCATMRFTMSYPGHQVGEASALSSSSRYVAGPILYIWTKRFQGPLRAAITARGVLSLASAATRSR